MSPTTISSTSTTQEPPATAIITRKLVILATEGETHALKIKQASPGTQLTVVKEVADDLPLPEGEQEEEEGTTDSSITRQPHQGLRGITQMQAQRPPTEEASPNMYLKATSEGEEEAPPRNLTTIGKYFKQIRTQEVGRPMTSLHRDESTHAISCRC